MADDIFGEKEELLAEGVLWSQSSSNTLSNMRTEFKRINFGSEVDFAQVRDSHSSACRERFRQRLRLIIHRLFDLIKANPFSAEANSSMNAALSANFWIALSQLEGDEVLNTLLPHFPEQVQEVLGKPTLTINGLLAIPRQAESILDGWIVYVDIVTGSIAHDQDKETGEGFQTRGLGLYVGSATGKGGGIQRWTQYDRYVDE